MKRYTVQVRLTHETDTPYCHWPLMQNHKNKRDYYIGQFAERYPTPFTKSRLGNAIAAALSMPNVAQIEVKEEICD